MPRRRAVDSTLIADVYPDGVARRAELLAAGLAAETIAHYCRPAGPWSRLLRGVILLTGKWATPRQRLRAALLHGRHDDAIVTGVAALRRLGVRQLPEDDRIQLLIPNGRQIGSRGFVVVERTRRLPVPMVDDGFPLAPPARALVDAARLAPRLDLIRAMVADAVQRRICSVTDLAGELDEPRRPWTRLPRQVLAEVADGVRSTAEAWARNLVRRGRLPEPTWNVELYTAAGRRLAVVDAYWREVGLAWEIDSREFHLAPADHVRDTVRQSRLAGAGLLVVHTVPSRLRRDPAGVLRELELAHAAASNRPAPLVMSRPWRPEAAG